MLNRKLLATLLLLAVSSIASTTWAADLGEGNASTPKRATQEDSASRDS
jgi:hypothetical protein